MIPRTKNSMRALSAALVLAAAASAVTATVSTAAGTTAPTTTLPVTVPPTQPTQIPPKRLPNLNPRQYIDRYHRLTPEDATVAAMPAPAGGATKDRGGEPPVIGPFDDNRFVDHGDSRWVKVASDAESTFGLDIDTGSYRVCQAFLAEGRIPPKESVRVEEWVNAFGAPRFTPTGTDLGVAVASMPAPHTNDGTQLVRLLVGTRELTGERPSANITFVVDTSGSMDIADRLGTVQASLALLVQQLDDDDTISIVEYGSEARIVIPPTPLTRAEELVAAIDSLQPMGSTNMQAGLELGYQMAHRSARPGAVNVVVLASDGVANTGVTDADQLNQMLKAASKDEISLVTVGYGMGNMNDDLMEQLADHGDGFYRYVDTFAEAYQLFVTELTPTLTVVARDAKIQVRFDAKAVSEYRLIGFENRQLDDSKIDDPTVDAGRLGAGHQMVALYEVRPVSGGPAQLGTVLLRWKDATGKQAETTTTMALGATPADGSVELSATVALTAEVVRGNQAVVDRGVTLAMLGDDAAALVKRGVPGADKLEQTLRLLQAARPVPGSVPGTVEG